MGVISCANHSSSGKGSGPLITPPTVDTSGLSESAVAACDHRPASTCCRPELARGGNRGFQNMDVTDTSKPAMKGQGLIVKLLRVFRLVLASPSHQSADAQVVALLLVPTFGAFFLGNTADGDGALHH